MLVQFSRARIEIDQRDVNRTGQMPPFVLRFGKHFHELGLALLHQAPQIIPEDRCHRDGPEIDTITSVPSIPANERPPTTWASTGWKV